MEAIDLLKEEKDYKSAVSASALFWALSSIVVLIFKPTGLFSSYVDALPFVIVISWLAGEIALRMPKRIPVAYCPNHGWRILPDYPLARLWMRSAWNNCAMCGRKLKIRCDRNQHLLTVYSLSELPEKKTDDINCSKCGDTISDKFSVREYSDLIYSLARKKNVPGEDEGRIGGAYNLKMWKAAVGWSGYIPDRELQELHQGYFLSQLKEIVSNTEFDKLLNPHIDEVIVNLNKDRTPYKRENHDDTMSKWEKRDKRYSDLKNQIQLLEGHVEMWQRWGAKLSGMSEEEFTAKVQEKHIKEMIGEEVD